MDRHRRGVWFVIVVALSLLLPACAAPTARSTAGSWSYVNTRLEPFWWHKTVDVAGAQAKAKGAGVTIAIVDTGVLPAHQDIATILPGVATCGVDPLDTRDKNGHGTQLAGIALGKNPGPDFAANLPVVTRGVAPAARLLPIKIDCGLVTPDSLVNGIKAATGKGANIVLISLGGYPANTPDVHTRLGELFSHDENKGILFVVASVWDGSTYPFPAWERFGNVIIVAAMTLADGSEVPFNDKRGAIWAPGRDIDTADIFFTSPTLPGLPAINEPFSMQGTSAASAIVAGCAALVKEKQQDFDGARLKKVLTDSAETKPDLPTSKRLNCNAAVP
jgi:subtilisin family serine protease